MVDTDGRHLIQLTVNSAELKYAQDLMANAIAPSGNKVRTYKANVDGDGWRVKGSSKEMLALCDEHVGRGSQTKRLSQDIMSLDKTSAFNFLGAYFNGDGSQTADKFSNRGELKASTTSICLASQVQTLCLKYGILCRKHGPYKQPKNSFGSGSFWQLTIPRRYAKNRLPQFSKSI